MNMVKITTFLNEIEGEEVERFVVREYNEMGHNTRTRVVSSLEDAEAVKLQWEKQ